MRALVFILALLASALGLAAPATAQRIAGLRLTTLPASIAVAGGGRHRRWAASMAQTSALKGACLRTVSGWSLKQCYDPVTSSYTADGSTSQTSFAAAGGTINSGCNITAGTGFSSTASSACTAPLVPSTTNFLVVANTVGSGSNSVSVVALGTSSTSGGYVNISSSGTYFQIGDASGSGSTLSSSLGGRVAWCSTGSGTYYVSRAGAAAVSLTPSTVPSSYSPVILGGTGFANSNGGVLADFEAFGGGTCNPAAVQAASAS